MAKDELEARVASLQKLIPVGRELHEKLGAVLEELDSLLGGGAGIGSLMKDFETHFDREWCARYSPGEQGRYIWKYAQDKPQVKRLLKRIGVEQLKARASTYIHTDDEFLLKNRHPFGLFVSGINSYGDFATPATELPLDPRRVAGDCTHVPRCRTDQEHTKKKMADMKRPR